MKLVPSQPTRMNSGSRPTTAFTDMMPTPAGTMTVLVQNLQKRSHAAEHLIDQLHPDVLLLQEINLHTEHFDSKIASNTSRLGYGTAIVSRFDISNVRTIDSPHSEMGGFIRKKTTIASIQGVDFVSFHGYNGQPFQDVAKLRDHVQSVVAVLSPAPTPVVFAGDFNTWSNEHVQAVSSVLGACGLAAAASWPYPGRTTPLDHAFTRNIEVLQWSDYATDSDHRGAILTLEKAL